MFIANDGLAKITRLVPPVGVPPHAVSDVVGEIDQLLQARGGHHLHDRPLYRQGDNARGIFGVQRLDKRLGIIDVVLS